MMKQFTGLRAQCPVRRRQSLTPHSALRTPHLTCRRAYGLAETAISVVIVSGMMIAALNAAGASRVSQRVTGDTAKAAMLATALMSEIMQQSYVEPSEAVVLGLETSEIAATDRTPYDDVDDYDGITESPPKNRDGTTIPNNSGWTRSVRVEFVTANDLATTAQSDTGLKRITVTVKRNNLVLKTFTAVKTNHSGILEPAADDGDED